MKDKDGKGSKVVKTTGSLDAKNRFVPCQALVCACWRHSGVVDLACHRM